MKKKILIGALLLILLAILPFAAQAGTTTISIKMKVGESRTLNCSDPTTRWSSSCLGDPSVTISPTSGDSTTVKINSKPSFSKFYVWADYTVGNGTVIGTARIEYEITIDTSSGGSSTATPSPTATPVPTNDPHSTETPVNQGLSGPSAYYTGSSWQILSENLTQPSSVTATVAYSPDPDNANSKLGRITLSWTDDTRFIPKSEYLFNENSTYQQHYTISRFLPDTKTWEKVAVPLISEGTSYTINTDFQPGRYYFTVGAEHDIYRSDMAGYIYEHHSKYTRAVVVDVVNRNEAEITKQPQNITAANGSGYSFSVSAKGDGLTYQWYRKLTGASSFSVFSGYTSSSCSGSASSAVNGAQFYCIVRDKYGNTVTSETVKLTTYDKARITTQPQSKTVEKAGYTTSTNITAVGEGLTYAWYEKAPSASSFTKSNKTSTVYSITVTEELNGLQIYCVVTDTYGNTARSNTVTMSIGTPLSIVTQPNSPIVPAVGKFGSIYISARGDGLTYDWYVKLPGQTSFMKTNVHGEWYTACVTEERNRMRVYCVVTDTYGNFVKSDTATMTISGEPRIVTQPVSVNVEKYGDRAQLKLTATGTGLTYQWYRSKQTETSFSPVSGATSDTYSIYLTTPEFCWAKMYCIVTDQNGKSVRSDTVRLTVGISVFFTVQPASVKVAKAGESVRVWAAADGTGVTYQWYRKRPNADDFTKVPGATSGTYTETILTASSSGTKVYCVATDSNGKTAQSSTATLSIAEPVRITKQPASVKVAASGAEARINVNASGDGVTYLWYEKLPNASGYTSNTSCRTSTYSTSLTTDRVGMQVYCLVSDIYGNQVPSDAVTLSRSYPKFRTASFVLPSGMTGIEAYAFDGDTSIVSVEIRSGCTSIGAYAFRDCTKLTKIRIPQNCTIGTDAFYGCNEVLIYGKAGSPAETYCRNHSNCLFVEE